MLDTTFEICRAALKGDKTLTANQRVKLLATLRDPNPKAAPEGNGNQPRILSRQQAAEMLGGKSCRFIDLLCRKNLLKKFTAPGAKRALGVTAESFNRFLEGGGQ
jgi:hypothetical protein